MKTRWPAAVDVVSARLFNTPAWYDAAAVQRSAQPIASYEAARMAAATLEQLPCFADPGALVCHLWNAVRRRPAEVRTLITAADGH